MKNVICDLCINPIEEKEIKESYEISISYHDSSGLSNIVYEDVCPKCLEAINETIKKLKI